MCPTRKDCSAAWQKDWKFCHKLGIDDEEGKVEDEEVNWRLGRGHEEEDDGGGKTNKLYGDGALADGSGVAIAFRKLSLFIGNG